MMVVKPGLDNVTKGSSRADQDDWDKSENGTVDTVEDDDEDDQILWCKNCLQLSTDWVFDILAR